MNKWDKKSIGELLENKIILKIQDGNHGEIHPTSKDYVEDGIPFVMANDLNNNRIEIENCKKIPLEIAEKLRVGFSFDNDVLLTHKGTVGNVAIVKCTSPYIMLTPQVTLYRVDSNKLSNVFLKYAFLEPSFQRRLRGFSDQSTRPYIGILAQRKLEIAFPLDIAVQQKIASILSAYDDLIENNLKRIRLLEEAAQHLYREWFVRFRFPGWKGVEVVDGLPVGWGEKTLGEMCHLTMGQSPSSDFYNEHGEGLPFHQGVTNYGHRFVSHKTFCTNETRIAEEGDILCSVRAPVGRLNVTIDKIVIGRGLSAMRNKDSLQSFQFYQLKNHFVQEDMIGGGTIFSSVTKKELESQVFVCPTKELMELFERVCKPMDEQIRNIHLQNQKLKEARDILLPRLMNQTIEV